MLRDDVPWRLWHKHHTEYEQYTRDELHGERGDPLCGVRLHVQLDAIADPEPGASAGLHADLVDAYHSTSNSGW